MKIFSWVSLGDETKVFIKVLFSRVYFRVKIVDRYTSGEKIYLHKANCARIDVITLFFVLSDDLLNFNIVSETYW